MMSDNDSRQLGPWPEDEAPPDDIEREQAERFARSLDALLEDDQHEAGDELQQTAGMIRASMGEPALARERRDALFEAALSDAGAGQQREQRPRTIRRLAPVLALAASLLLVLASALMVGLPLSRRHADPAAPPDRVLSRPSDALLGRPIEDRAGASSRLDLVFADRLGGYRQLGLARGGAAR